MWVVTVHECGGSTAEAIDVYSSFGGFTTEADAKQFAEILYETLTLTSEKQGGYAEWFTQHFEVPDIRNLNLPRGSQEMVKELEAKEGPIQPGEIALDMLKLAERLIEDEGQFKELPPAPKQEELDEALLSILNTPRLSGMDLTPGPLPGMIAANNNDDDDCECDIDYLDPKCRNPEHINPPPEYA